MNSSGFADIAFMLLFFFLVTTNFQQEQGITTQLPPYEAEPAATELIVREIIVNADDQILLAGESVTEDHLRYALLENLQENGINQTAFVLKNHEATSYATYLRIYSSLKAAYKDYRDEYALRKYGTKYFDAHPALKKKIEKDIPIRIAESSL